MTNKILIVCKKSASLFSIKRLYYMGSHLNILIFTRDAVRVYRLVASDVGRPLNDIRPIAPDVGLLPTGPFRAGSLDPL